MAWIGKVGGRPARLIAVARLPGAVIGVLLGHQFDRGHGAAEPAPRRRAARRDGRLRRRPPAACSSRPPSSVMGHLAKVDGRVSEAEIDAARERHAAHAPRRAPMRLAIELFNAGKQPDFPVDEQVVRLRRYCGGQPELLRTFLEIQMDLAAGQEADQRRRSASCCCAHGRRPRRGPHGPGPPGSAAAGPARHSGRAADRGGPGETLDGPTGARRRARRRRDREVKTAYRRLMNQHHPDKQAARGLPDSMLEIAKERTREIRAAYEADARRTGASGRPVLPFSRPVPEVHRRGPKSRADRTVHPVRRLRPPGRRGRAPCSPPAPTSFTST